MGNVAMDQMQLAPNRTSAFMSSWQNDLSGNTFSSNALTGRTAVSLLRNQGYASRVVSMRVSEQDVQDASRQVDAARGEAVAASTERSAVLSEAFSRGLSKLRSTRNTTGSTSSSFEQLGQTLNRLDQITKSVADRTGLTQSQVAQIAFGAAAHVGISTPFAGADARANAGKNYQSSLSAEQQKVLGSLTSEQLAEFKQFGDRVSRDSTVMNAIASDSRESKDLSSRLASAVSRTARADAAVTERTALAERLSAARDRGETIAIDTAQDPHHLAMFLRFAEQYGGNSASALALFEAELARQGLPPNRTFSDGTALPSSFGDIRRLHAGAADPTLAADIDAQASANRGKVSARATPAPFSASRTTPSGLRSEVEALGVDIRQQVRSDSAAVDARTETVSTPDGTLQSRKSLLKQAGKQVTKDASASVDNATEIVTDMFRKKK
jgi:conjugal transfer mating pair stabilization protein TraG